MTNVKSLAPDALLTSRFCHKRILARGFPFFRSKHTGEYIKESSEKHEEGVVLILTPEPNRITLLLLLCLSTILMQMTNASPRIAVIRHAIDGLETVLRGVSLLLLLTQLSPSMHLMQNCKAWNRRQSFASSKLLLLLSLLKGSASCLST